MICIRVRSKVEEEKGYWRWSLHGKINCHLGQRSKKELKGTLMRNLS